jgi:hypothetical protein
VNSQGRQLDLSLPELINHFFFCWHFPIPAYFLDQENKLFQENNQAKYRWLIELM